MLEGIKDIDWVALGYSQIPELLHSLLSTDSDEQQDAVQRLYYEVVLGGVHSQEFDLGHHISVVLRNDTQIILVPFLVKLLAIKSTKVQSKVLFLLDEMLRYKHLNNEGHIYQQRAEKIRTLIWNSKLIFLNLLSSQEIKVRRDALSILMQFEESPREQEVLDLIVSKFEPKLAI
jgi:hypothetical protein